VVACYRVRRHPVLAPAVTVVGSEVRVAETPSP
jgi:hypothetical protein